MYWRRYACALSAPADAAGNSVARARFVHDERGGELGGWSALRTLCLAPRSGAVNRQLSVRSIASMRERREAT